MRKILILIIILVAASYLSNAQNSHIINTSGNSFSPASLTINVGDTVTWNNTGGYHNINATQATFANNPEGFGNGVAAAPWSFQWIFTMPGTYDYQCDPHAPAMSGVIIAYCDPYDLTANNINATSANLNWTANGPTSFMVKYKLSGTVGWNTSTNGVFSTTVTTNSVSLSLLIPSTTYEWRIRPFGCTSSINWFDGPNFTTSSACNLMSSISDTDATCDNTMNGGADLTISGGATPYTFAWSGPGGPYSTENLSGVLAGTYTVQITDSVGCILSDTAVIGFVGSQSLSQQLTAFSPNPVTGYNQWSYDTLRITNTGCDVRIRPEFIISCSAGNIQQGDLTIKWQHPAGGNPIINYTIDGNGNAIGYWSFLPNDSTGTDITVGQINAVVVQVKFQNPALYGTYTATWETFEVDNLGNKIQLLSPSSSVSLSLGDCSTFSIDNISSSNISCAGGADGSASVLSILNGSGNYSYLWSNGSTNNLISNLSTGTYSVVVTDNSWGCTDSDSVIITEPSAITASLTGTNITCNGANDGTLNASGIGGSGQFDVIWVSHPGLPPIPNQTNLAADTYIIDVIDLICGDVASTSYTLTEPSILTISSSSANNTSCDAANCNGNIAISLSGGTQPYSYVWTNGYTDSIRNDLCGATYTIDATDANNCTILTNSISISDNPAIPSVSILKTNNQLCDTSVCNGNIILIENAGVIPYSYTWSTGDSLNTITGICGGDYSVTISDIYSCTLTDTISISDSIATLNINVISTNISCSGLLNGSAEVIILSSSDDTVSTLTYCASSPGSSDYSNIELVSIIGDGNSIVNNTAGICDTYEDYTSQFTSITSGETYSIDVNLGTCTPGQYSTDSAKVFIDWNIDGDFTDPGEMAGVFGGVQSPTSNTISFIVPNGYYGVTRMRVVSQYQGSGSGPVTSCDVGAYGTSYTQPWFGATEDYSIVINAPIPATYVWNTGDTTAQIINLSSGTYTCTVTDTNSCVAVDSLTIAEPTAIVFNASVSSNFNGFGVSCNGEADGAIIIGTPTGGTPPYQYSIDGGINYTATNINNLLIAGTYVVTVRDSNLCTKDTTLFITEPLPFSITAAATVFPAYNGSDVSCYGVCDGEVTVTTLNGVGLIAYTMTNYPSQTSPLWAGVCGDLSYTINATDTNACPATTTITLTEPLPWAYTVDSIQETCVANGQASINVSQGGTGALTYLWSNGLVGDTAFGLTSGMYSVAVNDANGCSFTEDVFVGVDTITLSFTITASCFGANNGSASVNVTGGIPPYTYSWSTGDTTNSIFSLAPGMYQLTVLDSTLCQANGIVEILVSANGLDITLDSTSSMLNVACFGDSSIGITVLATGGTGPNTYLYHIPNTFPIPQASNTFSSLYEGIYPIYVTDANGCYDSVVVTITEPTAITSSISITDVTSCLVANGSIDLTPNGGTTPYTFVWNNNETTEDISNLSAGNYTVTIIDTNGCTAINSASVNQPSSGLTLSLSSPNYNGYNISCYNGNNGTITANTSGGGGNLSYIWSTGDTINMIDSLTANIFYWVQVTEANGCSLTDSIILTEPTQLSSIFTSTNINCNADSTGNIDITPFGGTNPYTFSWDNGAITEDLTNVSAGQYIVTITDTNNCVFIDIITLTEPNLLYSSSTQTNVSCYGLNDGGATVNIFGGVADYILSWGGFTYPLSGGLSIFTTPVGVPAGIYPYTVTDSNGCTYTDTIIITQPDQLTLSFISDTICCFGNNDGWATVITTGGAAPFTYLWDDVLTQTTSTAIGLVAGNYSCTVTDINSCSVSDSTIVYQYAPLTATVNATDIDCFGNSNGSISMNPTGGDGNYSYSWSNGATTQNLSNLPQGTYSCIITDGCFCQISITTTIIEPVELTTSYTTTNVSCFGGNNGTVILNISGGTPGFIQDWGVNNPDSLSVGIYNYTITDTNSCIFSDSVTITEPTAITSSISITHLTSCLVDNGSIDLTPSGGTGAYTYLWNNNATTEDISNLSAGNYTVTITDANGCTATNSASVNQPSSGLTLSLSSSNYNGYNISCYNGNNGTITANTSGGGGNLSYIWSTGDTINMIDSLTANIFYWVQVTEANGCSLTDSIILTEPTQLSSIFTLTDVSCFGLADGGAIVNFFGGANGASIGDTNYILGWAGISLPLYFPNTIFNTALLPAPYNAIPPNNYPYTVTDNNGCTIYDTITINQPDSLYTAYTLTNFNGYNVSCFGDNNATIDVQINGGTFPFTHYFDGIIISNNTIQNLGAGTYTDSIIDNNSCVFTETITLTEPAMLSSVLSTINVNCNGMCDGTINTQINGGTIPYSYFWNNSSTNSNLDSLCVGNYILTITDNNGCTLTDNAIISEPTAIVINLDSSTNVTVYGGNDGTIFTSAYGGASILTYQWTGPNLFSALTLNISNLVAGTYYLTATDSALCSTIDSFVITQPPSLTAYLDTAMNLGCNGICTGEIYITADGGDSVYTYLWYGPNGYTSTDEDIDSLCAGSYTLDLSDNTNTVTLYFEVLEPTPVDIVSIADTAICYNGTAQATAYVYGGYSPYQTLWSNGSTNLSAILPAGIHTVSITDANGCIATDSITVHQADSISINSTVINVSCYGLQDAEVTLSLTNGGTAPFQYSANNGITYQTGNTFYNLAAGTADYLVIDINGCSNTITSTIVEPEELISSITATNASCYGECDGTATLAIAGGTPTYNSNWGSVNPNNLCAGFHNVIVTDANGCLATNSIIITEPNPVIVNIWQNGNTIEATTGFVSYQWYDGFGNAINGATNDTFIPTVQGEYSVEVTDTNDCSAISYRILVIIDYVNQNEIKLTIYPNPTKGKLTIESSKYLTTISVLNSVGNRVLFIKNNITFEKQTNMDLSSFAKGIYFIQIEINNQLINHRIILQ